MKQYIDLLENILANGTMTKTRNGNRLTIHGAQLRFNLAEGFPAVTTKKLYWKGVATELCWFLRGDTNTSYLREHGVHIWDANADGNGECGPIYGYQWRQYNGLVDQIDRSLKLLKKDPTSTRNVVSAWNPIQQFEMRLPPCHWGYQLHSDGYSVKLQASMRSSDAALGLPFNIASYALLCHLYAKVAVLTPTELIMDLGNIHLYESHIETAKEQVTRECLPLPTLRISPFMDKSLRELSPDEFVLSGYDSHPPLKYELVA